LIAWTRASQGAADPAWRALAGLPTRWTATRFPLKSADLTALGVPRGPPLGAAMRAAEEAWIAAGFPLDEGALDRIANDAARRYRL
jgi:poly(A) polymerase